MTRPIDAVVRHIRAKVLEWLRKNPPLARLTDQQLAEYVESLIRYRQKNPLDPANEKPPVLGGIGVADGLNLTVDILAAFLGIESGLILFDRTADGLGGYSIPATQTFPLSVYCGADQQAYVSGGGSDLPQYDDARYLFWGYRAGDPSGACLAWPDEFTLGADSEYESEGFYDAERLTNTGGHIIDPCWYSGKLRLAVQAKLNAGLSIDSLAPSGWLTGIRTLINCNVGPNDGLFHDGDYNYWLIRTDADGCRAVQLDIDEAYPEIECVRTLLRDYTVDDADQPRLEAYILAALAPVADSEIELLEADDLSDVYSDSAAPLYNGWKYSHQANTGITEASIVTLRDHPSATPTAFYYQSVLASIEFTVTGSAVTADLTVEETAAIYPHPGDDRVFIPMDGALCWWNSLTTTAVTVGTDAALYCLCYDKATDEREVLRYTYVGSTTDGAITHSDPDFVCAPGSHYEELQQGASKHKWTLDKNYSANLLTGNGYLIAFVRKEWDFGTETPSLPGGCRRLVSESTCTGSGGCCAAWVSNNSWYCTAATRPGSPGDCVQAYGNKTWAWCKYDYAQYFGATGRTVVVIQDGDCESLYVASYQYGNSLSSRTWGDASNDAAFTRVQYFNHNTEQWGSIGTISVDLTGAGDGIEFCDGSQASHTTGAMNTTTQNGEREDARASLITAHGLTDLDTTTPGDWDIGPDVNAYSPCLGYTLYTQASANWGDTYYWPKPGTAELTGSYGVDTDDLNKTKRFIGHA